MITEPFFRRNLPHWQPVGGTFFITYHHAGTKYSLWAYVIMPNHVHVVLQPDEVWMKRFTAGDRERSQYEKGVLALFVSV